MRLAPEEPLKVSRAKVWRAVVFLNAQWKKVAQPQHYGNSPEYRFLAEFRAMHVLFIIECVLYHAGWRHVSWTDDKKRLLDLFLLLFGARRVNRDSYHLVLYSR